MNVLFIGDIVGKTGRQTVKTLLPGLVQKHKLDFVIANGENAAGGFGINEKTACELFDAGVHVITTGNHVWDKRDAVSFISKENRILRPLNYPAGVPGAGSIVLTLPGKEQVAVVNVLGRVFMNLLDCPFRTSLPEVERLSTVTNIIIVDLHAEATSEKTAFGYYMDGKVSAVIGTHTHVQTADEKILPKGTAYITDVGMTGPQESVIGVDKEQIIDKFLNHMPRKYDVAAGPGTLSAVVLEIDKSTGKAASIQRLQLIAD
ncbi:MAG: TIGR00282 family metallophosphoesterase [Nitrospirae bacterium]|nr:TIGR00282 family metallophosphoesterase [Nitrospirota bacterium]